MLHDTNSYLKSNCTMNKTWVQIVFQGILYSTLRPHNYAPPHYKFIAVQTHVFAGIKWGV